MCTHDLNTYAGFWTRPAWVAEFRNPSLAVPTMLTASFARQRAFALELHCANQSLLMGTDAGINDIMPGSSLHDELEAFVQLGLSPVEALACCARGAACLLGAEQLLGVVSEGAIADLVLLDAGPTLDIRNARNVRGTMVGGRYHPVRG